MWSEDAQHAKAIESTKSTDAIDTNSVKLGSEVETVGGLRLLDRFGTGVIRPRQARADPAGIVGGMNKAVMRMRIRWRLDESHSERGVEQQEDDETKTAEQFQKWEFNAQVQIVPRSQEVTKKAKQKRK